MNVALINARPAHPQADELEPLGLCYLSSFLKANGHGARVLHQTYFGSLTDTQVLSGIREDGARLVGFTTYESNIRESLRLARIVKQTTGAMTVLGGPMASAVPDFVKDEGVDFVVFGEGELPILDLANAIDAGSRAWNSIPGLIWRDGGEARQNPLPKRIKNIDALPFPDRADLPFDTYHLAGYSNRSKHHFRSLITSRGCPFGCEYCMTAMSGRRWYGREASYVLQEVDELLAERPGVLMLFTDQDISVDPRRAQKMYEAFIEHPRKFQWIASTSVWNLTEEIVQTMAKSGCVGVFMGIESASKEIMDSVGRPFSADHTQKIVKAFTKTDIFTMCAYMVGFPSDTKETLRESRRLMRAMPVDISVVALVNPYPGTELFPIAVKEGWTNLDDYMNNPRKMFEPHMPTLHMTKAEVRNQFILTVLTSMFAPRFIWHHLKTLFLHPRRTKMLLSSALSVGALIVQGLRHNLKTALHALSHSGGAGPDAVAEKA